MECAYTCPRFHLNRGEQMKHWLSWYIVWTQWMQDFNEYPLGYILLENSNAFWKQDDVWSPYSFLLSHDKRQRSMLFQGNGKPPILTVGIDSFRSLGDDTPDRWVVCLFPLEKAVWPRTGLSQRKYALSPKCNWLGITTFLDMYYYWRWIRAHATDGDGRPAPFWEESVLEEPLWCNRAIWRINLIPRKLSLSGWIMKHHSCY